MKDFFFFTKGERNGLCLLLAAVCATIALSSNLANLISPPLEGPESFGQELEAFKASLKRTPPTAQKREPRQRPAHQDRHPQSQQWEQQPKQYTQKTNEQFSIEVNSADTAEFKRLRGIGSTYAARIVKFRERLGGFHSVNQLKEVYGISEELYESIRPHLKVNPTEIRKIDINDESFTFGFYHPYFPKGGVTKLVKRRKKQGRIERDSVKSILEMDEKGWEKLKHYLSE